MDEPEEIEITDDRIIPNKSDRKLPADTAAMLSEEVLKPAYTRTFTNSRAGHHYTNMLHGMMGVRRALEGEGYRLSPHQFHSEYMGHSSNIVRKLGSLPGSVYAGASPTGSYFPQVDRHGQILTPHVADVMASNARAHLTDEGKPQILVNPAIPPM